MLKYLKNFLKEEDGMGTVEIVIIIAVLVGIALIFRNVILDFVKSILKGVFDQKNNVTVDPAEETEKLKNGG